MGGYAAFVWPSYGIVFLVLAGMLLMSLAGQRARERELKALEERGGTRRTRRQKTESEGTPDDA